MTSELTEDECRFILECLEYTRMNFEDTEYPSYELKKAQLDRLSSVQVKLRKIRDSCKSG